MPTLQIHHVALSVTDLATSAPWYERLFELDTLAEFDEPAPTKIFVTPDGQALELRQDPEAASRRFTQTNVGLDHVGFRCSEDEMEKWRARFDEFGVEYSPMERSPFGAHLNFRDPDGIALEFFAPAG